MDTLISVFWMALEDIYYLLLAGAFLKLRRDRKQLLWGFAVMCGVSYLITQNVSYIPLKSAMIVLWLVLVIHYLFAGRLVAKVYAAVIGYAFMAGIDGVFAFGAGLSMGISFPELMIHKIRYTFIVTMCKVVELFFAYLLWQFKPKGLFDTLQTKWFLLTLFFPALTIATLMFAFTYLNHEEDLSAVFVVYAVISAVANVAILYVLNTLQKSTRQQQEMALLRQQMLHQNQQFLALEQNYRTQRRVTHEFEGHLQTMQGLLTQKEYDTLQTYLNQLQKSRALRSSA